MVKKNNSNANGKGKQNKNPLKQYQYVTGINGQGGYWSDNIVPFMRKAIPDGSFSRLGATAGGMLGGATALGPAGGIVGSKAGSYLGGKLAQILGFGDYQVVGNSLMKTGTALPEGMEVPTFGNGRHETVIRHREYIKDIVVPADPTAFSLERFKINAGNSLMFPWLSAVASRYQQYRVNGMVVEFKTMSSDITAGGALGTVVLATNYDAIAYDFRDKIEMENSQYACSAKPSRSQLHAVECDPSVTQSKLLYVRDSGASTATSDDRFYDLGHFQIATQGLPGAAGAVLGELWVSYDISLFKPDLASNSEDSTMSIVTNDGLTDVLPFGTARTISGTSTVATVVDGNTLNFPRRGNYILIIQNTGVEVVSPVFSGDITPTVSYESLGTTPTQFQGAYRFVTPSDDLTLSIQLSAVSVSDFSCQISKVTDLTDYQYI